MANRSEGRTKAEGRANENKQVAETDQTLCRGEANKGLAGSMAEKGEPQVVASCGVRTGRRARSSPT